MVRGVALALVAAACTPPPAPAPPAPGVSPELVSIVRAEARRQAGVDELLRVARGDDAGLRRRALLGLARVADERALAALAAALDDADPTTRASAALGLGIAEDASRAFLLASRYAEEQEPGVRACLVSALGRAGGAEGLTTLRAALEEASPATRAAAGIALGLYGRRELELDEATRAPLFAASADADRDVRFGAAYALAREHQPADDDARQKVLDRLAGDPDAEIRAVAIFARGKRNPGEDALLVAALDDDDWRVSVQAVRALSGERTSPSLRAALAAWLPGAFHAWEAGHDAAGYTHPVLEALERLSPRAGLPEVRAAFESVARSAKSRLQLMPPRSPGRIAVSAAHCWAEVGRVRAGGELSELRGCGGDGGWPLHEKRRLLAAAVAAGYGGPLAERLAILRTMFEDADPRIRAASLQAALSADEAALRQAGEEAAAAALDGDETAVVVGTVAEALGADARPVPPPLRWALTRRAMAAAAGGDAELRITLMQAAKRIDPDWARASFRGALLDTNPALRAAASEVVGEPPPAKRLPAPPQPPVDIESVLGRTLYLHVDTTRGEIVVQLEPELAPWAVAALVQQSERHRFDGTLWHRVVPDFVVQGGDPEGSGWGGPGFMLPGEPSAMPFARGVVGIADAGKDTGGSQWFIMHSRAPHLEGRYTAVGRVVSGLDVVDRLVVGDTIVSATVR